MTKMSSKQIVEHWLLLTRTSG